MRLAAGGTKELFIFSGTAREQPSVGVYCGSVDPYGCQANPRNYSRTKQQFLSRTAPDLPPAVREEIGRIFPDTAEEIRRAWVRIWWIACSICFATLWVQRNRWVHKHEVTTVDQAESELRHTLLRQLQAVAIRIHRFNRDGDDCVFFRLATAVSSSSYSAAGH